MPERLYHGPNLACCAARNKGNVPGNCELIGQVLKEIASCRKLLGSIISRLPTRENEAASINVCGIRYMESRD